MEEINRPQSLKEIAAERIRKAIVQGRLKMGESLSENFLAQNLHVSKTPIREALSLLNMEGLVKIVPQKGTFVFSMDKPEIIELCERLSGKVAKISYIPFITFGGLAGFFRFFESTWNIADRLQFGEIKNTPDLINRPPNEISWPQGRGSLESYLQEYFGKILRKLKETNYQQIQKSNEISFL